jgi:hypothetical protein
VSQYDDRPEDLVQDTKAFLDSEYGKYIMAILNDQAAGHLNNAANIEAKYPERHAAKYSAVKEVLNLLYSPLGDDTPSHG